MFLYAVLVGYDLDILCITYLNCMLAARTRDGTMYSTVQYSNVLYCTVPFTAGSNSTSYTCNSRN